eukprot:CAMPEP_0194063130 /NCGR_PEP_ID=MMETSP0009_2-20130614/79536_1 /TAXON_ID=210454 /ORGANISM="Grammatophora oceanica, Strain CCMP 410" /LENGTH=46 /DNA_ID= /DNA_START= /DNA_END= /DNA_ORIENTATION=
MLHNSGAPAVAEPDELGGGVTDTLGDKLGAGSAVGAGLFVGAPLGP